MRPGDRFVLHAVGHGDVFSEGGRLSLCRRGCVVAQYSEGLLRIVIMATILSLRTLR